MRQAAEMKLGFYPIPVPVVELLYQHLACDDPRKSTILDPCAGEGVALSMLGEFLQIPQERTYACELDPGRRQKIVDLLPKAHVPPACSFMGLGCSWGSFGLAYLNPPFSDVLGGGGREEEEFLHIATNLLCKDGVLVMVSPYDTYRKRDIYNFLDSHYREARLYKFPDENRVYHECVFIGHKRPLVLGLDAQNGYLADDLRFRHYYDRTSEEDLVTLGSAEREGAYEVLPARIWKVPACWAPTRFLKAAYTDDELMAALAQSSLNELAEAIEEIPFKEPPLPLDEGHIGLSLAAGLFDGPVHAPDGNHIVRGVSTKIRYYNEEASDAHPNADGTKMLIKEVESEDITLKIRAVDDTGTIYTFSSNAVTRTEPDMTKVYEMSYADADLYQKLRKMTVENGATEAEEAQAKARIQKLRDRYTTKREGTHG